jgi:hypothetical protein
MAVELIVGDKVKGESKNAIIACNDYLRMGPTRSLRTLEAQYRETSLNLAPTISIGTLNDWSKKFGWQERAEIYDAAIEAEKIEAEKARQRAMAERRKAIMEEGVALDFERVERLKRLADFLEAQVFYEPQVDEQAARLIGIAGLLGLADEVENKDDLSDIARIILAKLDANDPSAKYPHVWARDVRALAGGKTVDIVRFNSALLAELRATLDDIAKETGGRRQRTVVENIDYGKLTDEQLARIAAGEDPVQVILSEFTSS